MVILIALSFPAVFILSTVIYYALRYKDISAALDNPTMEFKWSFHLCVASAVDFLFSGIMVLVNVRVPRDDIDTYVDTNHRPNDATCDV